MNGLAVNGNYFQTGVKSRWQELWLLPGGLAAMFLGWLVARSGIVVIGAAIVLPLAAGFLIAIFLKPRVGLIAFMVYCFFMPGLGRHYAGQFGLLYDGILLLSWLGVLFWRTNRFRWRHLNNDLVWLCVGWFGLSVLEMGNPSRPSPQGWLQEVRGLSLYWLMVTPLVFFLFTKRKDLPFFLNFIIAFSLLAAFYGMKQLYIGVDAAENAWLEAGAKRTHMLFGKLRVFSFYSEAAQFGASQGVVAMICLVLALGPYSKKLKLWYAAAGLLVFYGMLISGTRGAMGALAGGGLVYLVLSKKVKVLIIGCVVGFLFFSFLKYTKIANNNDQIRRLRTSLDSNDPSLQVRLANQRTLSEYLNSRPFGTGVGTIGTWGVAFNGHIPVSKIPPDSLFVKIWVMYGVLGFIIWMGIMLFIIGKSVGIIWRTRDPALRNQLTALTAGCFGVLICSYGNEVLNQVPSMMMVYIGWALIWISPRWDTKPERSKTEHGTASQPAL